MRTGFVGRQRELELLEDCLTSARAGHPRVVLCRGEPGIGKTRLAEEFSVVAEGYGVLAVWGAAAGSAGAPPYWPWRQVLRALSEDVDLGAVAREHRLTADLARLAPDLFACPGSGGDGSGSSEDRFRLFDAVARLLREVTRDRSLVIVFDDAHWGDVSSLLLLQHVAHSMAGQRLLILVNHRDTEPLDGVLRTELAREPVTRELDVSGLARPAVGEQLTALLGADPTDAQVESVHARTGGNPFYVSEVGSALAEREDGRSVPLVPISVREAIGSRLERLSRPSMQLMQTASVVGREFSVGVVAAMVDRPVTSCLTGLDEATAAGMVEETGTPGEYRFAHDLVRDAIEAGLGRPERVRWHRRAAEALEELFAGRLEPHLSDLARHWAVAAVGGERARAAVWIRRAGGEAMHRLAHEGGARPYPPPPATGA